MLFSSSEGSRWTSIVLVLYLLQSLSSLHLCYKDPIDIHRCRWCVHTFTLLFQISERFLRTGTGCARQKRGRNGQNSAGVPSRTLRTPQGYQSMALLLLLMLSSNDSMVDRKNDDEYVRQCRTRVERNALWKQIIPQYHMRWVPLGISINAHRNEETQAGAILETVQFSFNTWHGPFFTFCCGSNRSQVNLSFKFCLKIHQNQVMHIKIRNLRN